MSRIRDFFERLLNSQDPTSSRRFTALVSLILFSATVIAMFFKVDIPSEILYATSGLALACLGLTSLKK